MGQKRHPPLIFTLPVLLAFLLGCGVGFRLHPLFTDPWVASPTEKAPIRACFSPEGNCTNGILSAIHGANASIFVQAYSFTSDKIATALRDAHHRGVDVRVLVDKSQLKSKHSQLSALVKDRIPLFIDSPKGLAHNKVMIIDERYVLTGSFNFTKAAESRNAENILLVDDPFLARIYKENWEKRAEKAKKL